MYSVILGADLFFIQGKQISLWESRLSSFNDASSLSALSITDGRILIALANIAPLFPIVLRVIVSV